MANLKVEKVNALPGTLAANTLYLIVDADGNYAQLYVSNSAGTAARRLPTKDDILDLIAAAGGGGGTVYTASQGIQKVGNDFRLVTPVSVSYLGSGTPGAGNFLRGDGSWQPLGTGTPTSTKFLRGDGAWAALGSGTPDGTKFLRDDGVYATPTISVTNLNATGSWVINVTANAVRIGANASGGVVSFVSAGAAANNKLSYFASDAEGKLHLKLASDDNASSASIMTLERNANVATKLSWVATEIELTGHAKVKSLSYDSNSLAASAVDCSLGNFFKKTVTTDLTWTATNVPASRFYSFILEITNGGAGVMTWFSGIKWTGGLAPTLSTVGTDILGFYTEDGGTTWRGLILSLDNKAPA